MSIEAVAQQLVSLAAAAGAVRRPAVAGYFYPADREALIRQIEAWTARYPVLSEACAVILPHGPYQRCGKVIGATLSRVRIPQTCVILGASHTDTAMRWSLLAGGAYQTPLGEVPVNESYAAFLKENCSFLEWDASNQRGEHAIEVVLPFLQALRPEHLDVVPIIINADEAEAFRQLARTLHTMIQSAKEPLLLIASSDLSHYEPYERLLLHDRLLLEAIQGLDAEAVVKCVEALKAKMCGYGAVACVLHAAKLLGANQVRLIEYATSRQAGGDPESVIGYAGLTIA